MRSSLPNLNILTHQLQMPLFDYYNKSNNSLVTFLQPLPESTTFGVLARIENHSNILRKTFSLLQISFCIWKLILKFKQQKYDIIGRFGVYPTIEDPVTIYELDSQAEQYCNHFILPPFPTGINGRLRSLIMRLARCHPSAAGIILIVKKQ